MEDAPLKFPDAETVLERDDYEAVDTVEELKRTLEDEGADLDLTLRQKARKKYSSEEEQHYRERNAYSHARKEWWKLNRRDVETVEEPLPTSTVEYRGKKCNLHGYVHGSMFFGPSTHVTDSLNSEVKARLEKRQPVLLEEGLNRHIYPENLSSGLVKSMNDSSLFSREPALIDALLAVPMLGLKAGKETRQRLEAGIGRFSDIPRFDALNSIDRARRSPGRLRDTLNVVESLHPPYSLKLDYAENHNSSVLRCLRRSAHQIETAVQKTPDEAEEVNLVVGLGHVSEIEHYVENPESISIDTL